MSEGSLTLERGLALLAAIAQSDVDGPTVTELAVELGISRPAVYRLLRPLETRGMVRRDGSRCWLGVGLLPLAGAVLPQLRSAARPVLRALADRVGATAHLTVADGEEALAVAVVEPARQDMHVAYRVGARHALYRGAGGRAIGLAEGWAASSGELQDGAHGVAAPLRGVPGLRASVGVISLRPLEAELVGPAVVSSAAQLAAALR